MPSSHKAQYNDRQKKRIRQLEALYDSVARQAEGLAEQNARLRLRSEVLSALVSSSDVVDALYAGSDAPTGPVGPDDRVRMITLALEWPELVGQLRVLVEAAEADSGDPGKLEAVVQAVRTLATYGIQAAARNDCERHVLLATVQLELLFPALQVPEEEHWRQVVAALHLTPDQRRKALLARELFQASMLSTLAPRPATPPPPPAPALAASGSGQPSSSAGAHHPQPPPASIATSSPPDRLAEAAMMGGSRVHLLYSAYQQATAALPSTHAPPAAAALPPQPAASPQPSSPTVPSLHAHTQAAAARYAPLVAHLPALQLPAQLAAGAAPAQHPAPQPALPAPHPGRPQLRSVSSLPHLPTIMRPLKPPTQHPHLRPSSTPPTLTAPHHLPPSLPLFVPPAPAAAAPPQLPLQLPTLANPTGPLPLQPTTAHPHPLATARSHPTLAPALAPTLRRTPSAPPAASQHQRLSAAVGLNHAAAASRSASPTPSRTPTPGPPPGEPPTLAQLEEYLVKFWDWSHTLAVYYGTLLLEPLQAARSYLHAYPLRLCPVAVLNTIHALSQPPDPS